MSKLKVTTVSEVHKSEETSVFPLKLLNKKSDDKANVDDYDGPMEVFNCKDWKISNIMKTLRCQIFQILGQVIFFILDFIINFCQSEWVRNVVIVALTVSLEVFVVMVLGATTLLTTIIVNIDEAYKSYCKINSYGSELLEDNKSECAGSRKNAGDTSAGEDGDGELNTEGLYTEDDISENVTSKFFLNNTIGHMSETQKF